MDNFVKISYIEKLKFNAFDSVISVLRVYSNNFIRQRLTDTCTREFLFQKFLSLTDRAACGDLHRVLCCKNYHKNILGKLRESTDPLKKVDCYCRLCGRAEEL